VKTKKEENSMYIQLVVFGPWRGVNPRAETTCALFLLPNMTNIPVSLDEEQYDAKNTCKEGVIGEQ
jgi:hypothetical protein